MLVIAFYFLPAGLAAPFLARLFFDNGAARDKAVDGDGHLVTIAAVVGMAGSTGFTIIYDCR
jgi:hypothetical protein